MINENTFFINKIQNIIFLGYSDKLENLFKINNEFKIKSFIVTSPDQNKKLKNKKFAKDIKIFQTLDIKFRNYIKKNFNIKNTLFISLSSRWIFKKGTINFLKGNLINIHSSRLPFDRGGATISWKIMRGDRIHGQTIHLVDEGVDTGPIIYSKSLVLPSYCQKPMEIEKFDQDELIKFYNEFLLKIIKKKKFLLEIQNEKISNYNPRLNTEKDAWIDWDLKPIDLYRFINAFDSPYSGAKTKINNNIVSIKDVHLHSGENGGHPFMNGIIFRKEQNWIVVKITNGDSLIIEKVIDKNNKNIISKLKIGDRFFTQINLLESAKSFRARYNYQGLKK